MRFEVELLRIACKNVKWGKRKLESLDELMLVVCTLKVSSTNEQVKNCDFEKHGLPPTKMSISN